MKKSKYSRFILTMLAAATIIAGQPGVAFADETTDFENWTPDGNGGYINNSTGQSGNNGSSDVHVSDEGSGRQESNSSTGESGQVINTETSHQSSVTITTTENEANSDTIKDVTNGEMIETGHQENSMNQEQNHNGSDNEQGDDYEKENMGDPKKPGSDKPSIGNNPNTSNDGDSDESGKGNGKPGISESTKDPSNSRPDYYDHHWGLSNAESMESVTVNEKGEWVITFKFSDGTVSYVTVDTAEEYSFVLTGVKDEKGERTEKVYDFHRSDELTEWIFKHYLWRAVNISFNSSSYYGAGKVVAKTKKSNAVFTLNEAGKYRVLATPYHDVRHYHIYEWEDDDGSHTEEITDYWEYDKTKAPDVYSVVVPIITEDGAPITVCVNGGCDCDTELNAVCDEASEPIYDIDEHVKLEK